jgi:hypothetical protein
MTETDLDPLCHAVRVGLPPEAAFELFTDRLESWWPLARFSCSGETRARVTVPPRVGAMVEETGSDGHVHPWGRVTAWDPPRGFAMSWHPGHDPAQATELQVTFAPAPGGGCEVRVRHGGWAVRPDARAGYDQGWPQVLAGYVAAARA